MNKQKKLLTLSLAVLSGFLITSCGGQGGGSSSAPAGSSSAATSSQAQSSDTSSVAPSSSEEPWYKKSERAMENFGNKLAAGNYTLSCEGKQAISVVDESEVVFRFDPSLRTTDFAAMAANNESFQVFLPQGQMTHLQFLDQCNAIEIAEKKLPNLWFDEAATGHGIWELFHNTDQEHPFHFTSKSGIVLNSIASFACLSDFMAQTVTDMSFDLDAEDPTVATINAVYYPSSPTKPENLTVTVQFGTSTGDERVEGWINDPNRVYPDPVSKQGKWEDGPFQLLLQSATNVHEHIDEAIPFIDFASYACWANTETFVYDKNIALIRDYHATQADVDAYKLKLVRNEFELVNVDGEPHYRRLLRARKDKGVYSDIVVGFEDGFYMIVGMYYESDKYADLDEINAALVANGFAELDADDNITGWKGEDKAFMEYENWMCLFDFECYPSITFDFENAAKAKQYLDDYGAKLEAAGFVLDTGSGDWIKSTVLKRWSVSYRLNSDGTGSITGSVQNFVDPTVAKGDIEAVDFPAVDMTSVSTCRDMKAYLKFKDNEDCDLAYEVTWQFETEQAGKDFIAAYVKALTDAGFTKIGTVGNFDYYNDGANRTVQVATTNSGGFAGMNFVKVSAE